MQEFFLSPEVALEFVANRLSAADGRWMHIAHSGIERSALVLAPEETLTIASGLEPARDSRLLLRYGAAQADPLEANGMVLRVSLLVDGRSEPLSELHLPRGEARLAPRESVFELGPYAGRACALQLEVVSSARPKAPHDGRIALYELAVAQDERMDNVRARAFHEERTRNELAHFSTTYDHAMYRSPQGKDGTTKRAFRCRSLEALLRTGADAHAAVAVEPGGASDLPDDDAPRQDAYHYAHHLLTRELRAAPPNFHARLRVLADRKVDGPLRILSLCCGAARIEASFASMLGAPAHWTLMDLNEGLLRTAAAAFPDDQSIDLISGNLNRIAHYGERYDVILCVSGLHHIVELEHVVGFIRDALVDGGEFWSIGEAIGRNGNRLWGRDYVVANAYFQSLPERLRRNRHSGAIDTSLPDIDYSTGTFEGIRSQDIEPLLSRYLEPLALYRRNCFLWRVVDLSYADNYDMRDPFDLEWLRRAVRAELAHFRNGGRPTELHGVFRRPSL